MFKVGQKVVYITGKNMPKDSIHIVSDIYFYKCGCGVIAINGEKLKMRSANGKMCLHAACGKTFFTDKYL